MRMLRLNRMDLNSTTLPGLRCTQRTFGNTRTSAGVVRSLSTFSFFSALILSRSGAPHSDTAA